MEFRHPDGHFLRKKTNPECALSSLDAVGKLRIYCWNYYHTGLPVLKMFCSQLILGPK